VTLAPPELAARLATAPPRLHRAILRCWLEATPRAWLRFVRPSLFSAAFPPGPKRDLVDLLATTPAAERGRPPVAYLAEMGRGLGKSLIMRWYALARALAGLETGIVFAGAKVERATDHTRVYLQHIPPLRARESGSDPAVLRYLQTPLGYLYPSLRISGTVTSLVLHLHGRRIPVWAIGQGAATRGLVLDGTRPSLLILDDLVTLESAHSERQTASLLDWIHGDAAGLGTEHVPAAIWWATNAIAVDDAPDRAARSGRWRVVRGAVWTPHAPPPSPEHDAILRALLDEPADQPLTDAFRERWTPVLPDILGGAEPTDPDQSPWALLRVEARMGPRAFAREAMCVRLVAGEALWPMASAHLVDLAAGQIREPEGTVALAACRGAVWLDPRASSAAASNDFAAAAAVVRAPSGRRYVLAIEAERARTPADQRALYWRAVDALISAGCTSIVGGYETNSGAGLFLPEADWYADAAARRARGYLSPIPEPEATTGAGKYSSDRLDRVTDHIADGRLRFARELIQSPSWSRLSRIPHDHDDDADAIERADHLLVEDFDRDAFYRGL